VLEPERAVDLAELFLLVREQAREHECPAGTETRGDRPGERNEHATLDVREHDPEAPAHCPHGALGDSEAGCDAIGRGVLARSRHRLVVDVHTLRAARTEEQRAD